MILSVAPEKSPATPLGIDPEVLRLVAQRLNYYATPGPIICVCICELVDISPTFSDIQGDVFEPIIIWLITIFSI